MNITTKTNRIVRTGLLAALCCIATMVIRIPTPGTGGYVHLGDAFVILSGIILGPIYGALAAGIGSAFADLFGGYFVYAGITFFVKGVIALGAGFIYHKFTKNIKSYIVKSVLCGIFATIFVAAGYLGFELLMYGVGAVASVPANLIQGLSGLIISTVLLPALKRFIDPELLN